MFSCQNEKCSRKVQNKTRVSLKKINEYGELKGTEEYTHYPVPSDVNVKVNKG
jgi:hypothetical protein